MEFAEMQCCFVICSFESITNISVFLVEMYCDTSCSLKASSSTSENARCQLECGWKDVFFSLYCKKKNRSNSRHLMQWRNHTASQILINNPVVEYIIAIMCKKILFIALSRGACSLINTPILSAVPHRSLGPGSPSAGPLLSLYATWPYAQCTPFCSSLTQGYQPRLASALSL